MESETIRRASIAMAMAAEMNCKVAGMVAENARQAIAGHEMPFGQKDFDAVVEEYNLTNYACTRDG